MSKAEKQQVPKIRFEGFSEDWEKFRLNEICSHFQSGKGITAKNIFEVGEYPVYGGNGLRGYTHEFTHEGQYVLIGRQGALCGNIHIVEGESYISEHAVAVQANSDNDTRWLGYWLHNKNLGRLSESSAQPGLAVNKLVTLKIVAPCGEEQNKIGVLIYQLDTLIEFQTRAVESAETYKKAMLQKMFPQKGEKVPRVRFEGFSGDWKLSVLNKLADRFDNLRIPVTASDRIEGETPYYGANGIQGYVEGFTHEGEFVLLAEDGANDLTNYPVQHVFGKIWVNNHAHVLGAKKDIMSNSYLANVLKTINMIPYLVGSGRAKLNSSAMMEIKIKYPTLEEQTLIGNFFQKLDQNIESEKKKLEQYQTMKRAMLQRMFI